MYLYPNIHINELTINTNENLIIPTRVQGKSEPFGKLRTGFVEGWKGS